MYFVYFSFAASQQTSSQQAPSFTSLLCGKEASIEEPTGFQREQAALNELSQSLGNSSKDVFSSGGKIQYVFDLEMYSHLLFAE